MNIYAVSHSNLMQCGVTIFELQNKVNDDVNFDFDFAQNAWTLELKVRNGDISVNELHKGISKPEPNASKAHNYLVHDKHAPSTIITEDRECAFDSSALNLAPAFTNVNASIGGFGKEYLKLKKFPNIKKPCFASQEMINKSVKFYKNAKLCPPAIKLNTTKDFTINITRHGNSCNNIVPDKFLNLSQKKSDPSLSDFGVWSLTDPRIRPAKITELANARKSNEVVFVSPCIRTWETSTLIYGGDRPLTLLISPYLKEKGNYSGNMPEPIPLQRNKINAWIKRHKIPAQVTIKIAGNPDIEIYPKLSADAKYSPEHTTFYADGIQKFCKWVTERDVSGGTRKYKRKSKCKSNRIRS